MGETEKYNCEWKNLVHRKYTHIILGGKYLKVFLHWRCYSLKSLVCGHPTPICADYVFHI